MAVPRQLGRFVEPAIWTLIALRNGPQQLTRLFDTVRSLDGPIGHGTLLASIGRLERLDLVERAVNDDGRPSYRLTRLGNVAARSAGSLSYEGHSS